MRRLELRAAALFLSLAAALSSSAGSGPRTGVFSHSSGGRGKISLTFDDGPHPRYTGEILDVLVSFGVRATFFVVGENAEKYPDLIMREVEEGHEIGNHTFDHENVREVSFEEATRQILETGRAVSEVSGFTPRLFRPPEGKIGDEALRAASELGYTVVLWSVDTRDWTNIAAGKIARAAKAAKDGDVILCHDFISGESHTAEALRTFIPELQSRGYEFVTVSELINSE